MRKGDTDAVFKTGAVAAGPEQPPAIAEPDDGKVVLTKLSWYMPNNWIKIKSPSWLPNDSMRLDPSPPNEKFHLAIVSEINPGEASLENQGVSDR